MSSLKSTESRLHVVFGAFVLLATCLQDTDCVSLYERVNPSDIICTGDTRIGIMEVVGTNQHFAIKLGSHFKYLQISMKIDDCYSHSIFRGNYYLTGKTLHLNHTEETIPMDLSYRRIGETHAYHLALEVGEGPFYEDVDTSEKCGTCGGFMIKAVGASICSVTQKLILSKNALVEGPSKSSSSNVTQDKTSKFEGKEESSSDGFIPPTETKTSFKNGGDMSQTVRSLQMWANSAYAVAVCLSLSVYLLFLIGKTCQMSLGYAVLDDRQYPFVPEEDP